MSAPVPSGARVEVRFAAPTTIIVRRLSASGEQTDTLHGVTALDGVVVRQVGDTVVLRELVVEPRRGRADRSSPSDVFRSQYAMVPSAASEGTTVQRSRVAAGRTTALVLALGALGFVALVAILLASDDSTGLSG